jgi:hypothetical protein
MAPLAVALDSATGVGPERPVALWTPRGLLNTAVEPVRVSAR